MSSWFSLLMNVPSFWPTNRDSRSARFFASGPPLAFGPVPYVTERTIAGMERLGQP
jgi:hypothetical protein